MNYTQTSVSVGNLIKSFLFWKVPVLRFLIFKVRRLAIHVDPLLSEIEQHHSKFVLPPLVKIQSKYAEAHNQKQKREI